MQSREDAPRSRRLASPRGGKRPKRIHKPSSFITEEDDARSESSTEWDLDGFSELDSESGSSSSFSDDEVWVQFGDTGILVKGSERLMDFFFTVPFIFLTIVVKNSEQSVVPLPYSIHFVGHILQVGFRWALTQ
ncbi:Kelch repeat and BTB domain-containing protein 6 [Pteropus alecto]|uniref:Kelch repeat and BTB domain-containing protein 6 n=1 Tax=Pteropus alecto TaxID=9402 RepID=L5KEC1_PTEAL|nr:Kelch repeat and BTB domain-containing protein 6 [Pteropus alecto]